MSRNLFEAWLTEFNEAVEKIKDLSHPAKDLGKDKKQFEKAVRLLRLGWGIYVTTRPGKKEITNPGVIVGSVAKVTTEHVVPSEDEKPWWSPENGTERAESFVKHIYSIINKKKLQGELSRVMYKAQLSAFKNFLFPGEKLPTSLKIPTAEQYVVEMLKILVNYSAHISETTDSACVFPWGIRRFETKILEVEKQSTNPWEVVRFFEKTFSASGLSYLLMAFESVLNHRLEARKK